MSKITNNNTNTSELVFVPAMGMGHLLSAIELSKLILSRDNRISITILIINKNIVKLNSYINSQLLNNPDPTRFSLRILPTLDPLPTTFSPSVDDLYKPLVKKAVEELVGSGSPKPVGFIFDMFFTNMIDVACELDIPCYIFHPCGANFLNLMLHAESLVHDHGVDVATEFSNPDVEFDVPGFKKRVMSTIIPALLQDKESCPVYLNHTRRYKENIVKGILVNTFIELENFPIRVLMDGVSGKGDKVVRIPKVYPVGPILELDTQSRGDNAEDQGSTIITWLDHQPKSSVVFLCFGSIGWFGADQVQEIANGLDRSGFRFLWSLRKPPPESSIRAPPSNDDEIFIEALPKGFLERTSHKGKVVGWAPQVTILAHPAIGGFISHCGWNSTLESLGFGVPIGTWPMHSEQQLNAFELLNELELAVEITMDYKQSWKTRDANHIVKAEVIEMGISRLMGMDENMRTRVKVIKDKSRKTLQNGGSSYDWLSRFVQDVLDNVATST